MELVAQGGLLSLVVLCVALAWRAQRRGPHELGRIAAAGAGAALAYVASELLEVLVAQSRPCARDVDALLPCPALSDYSWPSNHATIAGALLATALLAPIAERAPHRLDGFARGGSDTPEITRQPVHHTTRK